MTGGRNLPEAPPNILNHLDDVLPTLRVPRLGVIADFDGTLSEITQPPAEAKLFPGCAGPLTRLAQGVALVAVVSGRSAADVARVAGLPRILYVGNHGAEYLSDSGLEVVPAAEGNEDLLKAVFDDLRANADGPGLVWEDKGFSLSVHYRAAPDPIVARHELASAVESMPHREVMEVFWGKQVLEVRPRSGTNKGHAVLRLIERHDLAGVVFLGDDTTDVDGMRALRKAADEGSVTGLGVAVVADDSPAALLQCADYSLESVARVADFLSWVADVTTGRGR